MALKRGAVAAAVLTTAVFAGPAHHHHPTQQRLHYGSSQGNYDVQYLSTAAQRNRRHALLRQNGSRPRRPAPRGFRGGGGKRPEPLAHARGTRCVFFAGARGRVRAISRILVSRRYSIILGRVGPGGGARGPGRNSVFNT